MFGNGGMGIKPPDNDAIPIPWSVHRDIDNSGERTVLCERFGFSLEELRRVADGYYLEWTRIEKHPKL